MILHRHKTRITVRLRSTEKLGELPGVHAGSADVERFALIHDLGQRFQRFFDRGRAIIAMNLVQIDVVDTQTLQAGIDRMTNMLFDVPRSFGVLPIGLYTFVAMTVSSRRNPSFLSARPVTSSLAPSEYISAVSKKLIPDSTACLKNGSEFSSSRTQSRHFEVP